MANDRYAMQESSVTGDADGIGSVRVALIDNESGLEVAYGIDREQRIAREKCLHDARSRGIQA